MDEATQHDAATVRYWNAVSQRYLELFRDEFQSKPFDQEILRSFAGKLAREASVLDAGCGPCGHVARLLAKASLNVTGIDVSPACIALARKEQPDLHFEVMNMAAMEFSDCSFAGLISYYSLHYQPKARLGQILREFARVTRAGGWLLIVVKQGDSEGWIDDPMGSGQRVFWCDFQAGELCDLVSRDGWELTDCSIRDPLSSEISVRRIYLTARRLMNISTAAVG